MSTCFTCGGPNLPDRTICQPCEEKPDALELYYLAFQKKMNAITGENPLNQPQDPGPAPINTRKEDRTGIDKLRKEIKKAKKEKPAPAQSPGLDSFF